MVAYEILLTTSKSREGVQNNAILTHYRPAMAFGNRKKNI